MNILGAPSDVKKRPLHLLASHILNVLSGIHSVTHDTFLSALILSLVIHLLSQEAPRYGAEVHVGAPDTRDDVPYRQNNCLLHFSRVD